MNKVIPRDPVPRGYWGKDHWSMLAYIECRCVDNKGVLDRDHMRVDADRHPGFGNSYTLSGLPKKKHPTLLRDGLTMEDHDDWDCADDLEKAGIVTTKGTGMFPIFSLTESGKELCALIRQHKSEGGSFGMFRDTAAPPA